MENTLHVVDTTKCHMPPVFKLFQHLAIRTAGQSAATTPAKKLLCSRNNKFGPQHPGRVLAVNTSEVMLLLQSHSERDVGHVCDDSNNGRCVGHVRHCVMIPRSAWDGGLVESAEHPTEYSSGAL